MASAAFFTNFDAENSLKWPKLVDKLEEGMMRYSTGGVKVPVRAMLRVEDHNGYLGNVLKKWGGWVGQISVAMMVSKEGKLANFCRSLKVINFFV